MVKITVLLILSITLVATWFSSYVAARYPAPPNLYVQVAPWWHIGLFVAWAVVQLWANMLIVLWIYDWRSRRKNFPQNPPQHAG